MKTLIPIGVLLLTTLIPLNGGGTEPVDPTNPSKSTTNKQKSKVINATLLVQTESLNPDSVSFRTVPKPGISYTSVKQGVLALRNTLRKQYEGGNKKGAIAKGRQVFTTKLLNDIIPYWYGTEWDFNGYTNTPGTGTIACGYFVSTTLKHMGVNVNRYHLAQQAALNEIKSLQTNGNYHQYHNMTLDQFITKAKSELKPGLYVIGLDFHVGYFLIRNNEAYFIHSDYFSDKVRVELASESNAIESNSYYLGDITNNDELIRKWITGETVEIVRN